MAKLRLTQDDRKVIVKRVVEQVIGPHRKVLKAEAQELGEC